MPRYFFHYHDGQTREDKEGIDLPSDREAWRQGVLVCGQLLQDFGPDMRSGEEYQLECLAEGGRGVFSIRFTALLLLQYPEGRA